MTDAHSTAAEIAAVSSRFLKLFAANDVAGIAECYTEDAQMMPANMAPVRGRAAIESVFKFTHVPGHTLDFSTEELELYGDTALELGSYVRRQDGGGPVDHGRYMVVWKRVSGAWKIHRDMFSSIMPRTVRQAA